MTTVVLAPDYTGHFWADESLTRTTHSHGNVQFLLQIAVLFTLGRLIKQRRVTRLQAFTAQTVPKLARSRSAYHFLRNFGKKFLTNGTGLENVSEKRNGLELYHLQNTRRVDLGWNKPPSTSRASLALVNQTNGTKNFGRFGKKGKKVTPRKVLLFSGKFPPGWTVPFEFSSELPGFPYKW